MTYPRTAAKAYRPPAPLPLGMCYIWIGVLNIMPEAFYFPPGKQIFHGLPNLQKAIRFITINIAHNCAIFFKFGLYQLKML